jgi:hypothetical protein
MAFYGIPRKPFSFFGQGGGFTICRNIFSFVMQHPPYVPTITNYTKVWWVPNVVVAHLKEGIEALHLASGRTLCKVNIKPLISFKFDYC